MGKTLKECKLKDYKPEISYYECVRGYRCEKCKKEFAIIAKKVEKPVNKRCPGCKITMERQVLGQPLIFVSQDPTTLGGLAEKNTQKMGTYELEDKRKAHEDSMYKGKETLLKEQGLISQGSTASERNKEAEELGKINRMTPEEKQKYVMTGEGL